MVSGEQRERACFLWCEQGTLTFGNGDMADSVRARRGRSLAASPAPVRVVDEIERSSEEGSQYADDYVPGTPVGAQSQAAEDEAALNAVELDDNVAEHEA